MGGIIETSNYSLICFVLVGLIYLTIAYNRGPLWSWFAVGAVFLFLTQAGMFSWILLGILAALFLFRPLRRHLLSFSLMNLIRRFKLVPAISETERIALRSGGTWIDGDFFSGRLDFDAIHREPSSYLSEEEQAFLDGHVEEVSAMVDDWEVYQNGDMPQKVWNYLKQKKFLGMIIPKKYGGLEFSAEGHSAVIQKLASRCYPLAITVMVPNSLGPAELLIEYGTEKQKNHYLPRLANGREIPCFALTEPGAGSDAASIRSAGVLFKNKRGELSIRLNYEKRYITLAAISTVIGLAFKLRDPENLLGQGENLGITCALISSKAKGVTLGRRHDPMGVPFYNCPVEGKDVIISIDEIIGGRKGIGQGWKMLMESLAAGRGISLPATGAGSAKLVARTVSAYGFIREQFGIPIGRFEGIEEPLARIGAHMYLLEAARKFITSAIDRGKRPPVITAIAKYYFTEIYRKIINDGMDILGGAAISKGPRNLLAHSYMAAPISITVEGSNIMTRTLIHFGQGFIRCHPYVYREIEALKKNDLRQFDLAFWSHVGHVVTNLIRVFFLSITRGWVSVSNAMRKKRVHYRRLSWATASFALAADTSLLLLGGNIKRREKISGRFGDILSWLFLCTAVLHRYRNEGYRPEDEPFVDWTLEHGLHQIQKAFDGIYTNFAKGSIGWLFRIMIAFWSRINPFSTGPKDDLGHEISRRFLIPGSDRDRLTDGIYIPKDPSEALCRLENAMTVIDETTAYREIIKHAMRRGDLPKGDILACLKQAVENGLIDGRQAVQLRQAEAIRYDAVQVDAYTLKEYLESRGGGRLSKTKRKPKKSKNP